MTALIHDRTWRRSAADGASRIEPANPKQMRSTFQRMASATSSASPQPIGSGMVCAPRVDTGSCNSWRKPRNVSRPRPLLRVGCSLPGLPARSVFPPRLRSAVGRIALLWRSLLFCRLAACYRWVRIAGQDLLPKVSRGVSRLHVLIVTLVTLAAEVHAADPMAPPRVVKKGEKIPNREQTFTPAPLLWTRVGAEASLAWYGGRLVQTGNEVEGARIEYIAEDHIILSQNRRLYRVPLLLVDGIAAPGADAAVRPCKGGNSCPMPHH